MSHEDPTKLGEGKIVETAEGKLVFIPEDDRNYTVVPFASLGESGVEFAEDVPDVMRQAFHDLQDRTQETSSYRVLRLVGKRVLEDMGVHPITDAMVAELALSVRLMQPRNHTK